MTLNGKVILAPDGSKGFDCNTVVSQQAAKVFKAAGYDFAIRYVGRHEMASFDIHTKEAEGILAAGLGLMLVQHVKRPPWIPSGPLGVAYGAFAALSAQAIGYVVGATIWCDLEGVAHGVPATETIAFCNNWIDQVGHAGFTPGLYVGFDCGLTAIDLYAHLRFEHYWNAYNGNVTPVVRGFQMQQHTQQTLAGITFDPNTVKKDALGMLPLILAPEGWTAP